MFGIHIYIDNELNTFVLFLEVMMLFIVLRHLFDNWVMYHVTCRHTTLIVINMLRIFYLRDI